MTEEQVKQLKPGTCLKIVRVEDGPTSLMEEYMDQVVWFLHYARGTAYPVRVRTMAGSDIPLNPREVDLVE